MKKYIKFILIALAVVFVGIKGKGLLKSKQNEVENEALPLKSSITVHTVKSKNGEIENRENFLATIASDQSIKLSTKLAGFVQKIYVQESDMVKKGDPLVSIDAKDIRSNLEALNSSLSAQRADLSLARSIYRRNQKLYRVGGLAKEKLDLSRVALSSKEAQINSTISKIAQSNNQLSYLLIKAPFDGIVDSLLMQEGDLAATGRPILSLSNGKQKLLFSFAPTTNSNIKKGNQVYVDDKEVGDIRAIYPTSKNGLTTAEVELKDTLNMPVGSSLNIEVATAKASGCKISQGTILHKSDGLYVMEYKDNSFTPLKVTSTLSNENFLVVKPCPKNPIAKDSEVKLAKLPAYKNVTVIGAKDE